MSTIRIKVEDELYKAINAILREKDITISEAVTSYLRAVIWTNSLALDVVINKEMVTPGVEEVGYNQMPLPTEPLASAEPEQHVREAPPSVPEPLIVPGELTTVDKRQVEWSGILKVESTNTQKSGIIKKTRKE